MYPSILPVESRTLRRESAREYAVTQVSQPSQVEAKMKFAVEDINDCYLSLSRGQVARALGICTDTLEAMHARGEGPPRFRAGVKRWGYPAQEFRRWQERRLAEAETNAA